MKASDADIWKQHFMQYSGGAIEIEFTEPCAGEGILLPVMF